MTELTQDLSLAQARSLIDSYAFDLGCDDPERLFDYWLELYHASWIRLATIEALYLGRYKAISVEHILNVWLRLGTPNPHFTYEFERLICRKLPKHLSDLSDLTASAAKDTMINLNASDSNPKTESETPIVIESETSETIVVDDSDTSNLEKAFRNSSASESNMSLISTIGLSCKSNWSDFTEGSKVIHQFIPLPDVSSFFARLKTFGE
jgi:hypothetical protein